MLITYGGRSSGRSFTRDVARLLENIKNGNSPAFVPRETNLIVSYSSSTYPITSKITQKISAGDWRRAAGDCLCPVCNLKYSRHKNVETAKWLTIICNNELYKL